jgi:LMBR1-like membrane protein
MWLAIVGVTILVLLTTYLLHRYTAVKPVIKLLELYREKCHTRDAHHVSRKLTAEAPNSWHPPAYVLLPVWIGWFLCLSVVLLIGVDVSDTAARVCIARCAAADGLVDSDSGSGSGSARFSVSVIPSDTAAVGGFGSAPVAVDSFLAPYQQQTQKQQPQQRQTGTTGTAAATTAPATTAGTTTTTMATTATTGMIPITTTGAAKKPTPLKKFDEDACVAACESHRLMDITPDGLKVLWLIVYWVTYVFCWTVFPLLQSYSMAGEFHILEKWRRALKENLIFYGVCGAVMAVLIIYIAIQQKLNGAGIIAVSMAASNAWGMFLLFCTLGYGLVEIPKRLWRSANPDVMLRYCFFQAALYADQFEKAHREFREMLQSAKQYDNDVRRDDIFRDYVDQIVARCPPAAYRSVRPDSDSGKLDMSYSALVALHRRVAVAEHDLLRTKLEYEFALQDAFALEDVIRTKRRTEQANGGDYSIPWTFPEQRKTLAVLDRVFSIDQQSSDSALARILRWWQWAWHMHIHQWAARITAVFLLLIALLILWSEQIFGYVPELSLFFLVLQDPNLTGLGLQLMVLIPVAYIAYCSFSSLFRLRYAFFSFFFSLGCCCCCCCLCVFVV